jgi:hypothetical protein
MSFWTQNFGNTGLSNSKIKVSATDTTPDYLLNKLVVGAGITLTQNNIGGNETITVASTITPFIVTPTGATDGVNTTYTLPYAPVGNIGLLIVNNQPFTLGTDYTISGTTLTAITVIDSRNYPANFPFILFGLRE